jgi:opacity protein-like surface antigen
MWVSGGAFMTGGGMIPYDPGFGAFGAVIAGTFPAGTAANVNPKWSWDGAVGADYRFAGTPWHVNTEGRFGWTNKLDNGSDSNFTSAFFLAIPGVLGGLRVDANATTTPQLHESHWQADGGLGYDFMRGAQLKFGFRVAEIKSDLEADTNFLLTVNAPAIIAAIGGVPSATASIVEKDRRSFLGAGPRIGVGGSVPILGPLAFDYSADAAILFGNTKLSSGQVVSLGVTVPTIFAFGIANVPVNQVSWSAPTTVYNFDVEAGLSYWFTPNLKLGVSYRLDAFIDPLRIAPDDGALNPAIGPGRSVDRFYHGPKATLAAKF